MITMIGGYFKWELHKGKLCGRKYPDVEQKYRFELLQDTEN
jgi:hypothetical protein